MQFEKLSSQNQLIANRRAIVKCSCQVHTEEAGARTEQSEEAELEAIQFECVERDAATLERCRVGDGWSVQQCFEASDCLATPRRLELKS